MKTRYRILKYKIKKFIVRQKELHAFDKGLRKEAHILTLERIELTRIIKKLEREIVKNV